MFGGRKDLEESEVACWCGEAVPKEKCQKCWNEGVRGNPDSADAGWFTSQGMGIVLVLVLIYIVKIIG